MIDCFRYSDNDLAEYCEVRNNVLQWLLTDTSLTLTLGKHRLSDRDTIQYTVCRHDILYGEKLIGELVRYVCKTRLICNVSVDLLTRFELDVETDDSIGKSIIEFSVMTDRMSSNETVCKMARLKELAILAKQMTILNTL